MRRTDGESPRTSGGERRYGSFVTMTFPAHPRGFLQTLFSLGRRRISVYHRQSTSGDKTVFTGQEGEEKHLSDKRRAAKCTRFTCEVKRENVNTELLVASFEPQRLQIPLNLINMLNSEHLNYY